MTDVSTENLFPLPLTAFEEFMLTDGTEEYPMVFFLRVRLKGVVEREVLNEAIRIALTRHPLLACRVQKQGSGFYWVPVSNPVVQPDWNAGVWKKNAPWTTGINLFESPGVRSWAQQTPGEAELTLQFHHACCDGIAAARFLEDIAIGYARLDPDRELSDDELPEFTPLNPELLRNRGEQKGRRVGQVRGSVFRRIRILWKYSLRYLRQQKVPLQTPQPPTTDCVEQELGLWTYNLSRKATRAVREAAKKQNATLNDLLVSELMITTGQWNREHDDGKPKTAFWKKPVLCVLVPSSLRGPDDVQLSVCNVVSYVFMARDVDLIDEPEQLLLSIRDEMGLANQAQAGWLFIQALQGLKRIPGLLNLIKRRTGRSCMSTTVLSHMGNLLNSIGSRLPRVDGRLQMGSLQVEEIVGIPPVREGTSAVFSTMMVNGCLSVCIRCCPRLFTRHNAKELLEAFVKRLELFEERAPEQKTRQAV